MLEYCDSGVTIKDVTGKVWRDQSTPHVCFTLTAGDSSAQFLEGVRSGVSFKVATSAFVRLNRVPDKTIQMFIEAAKLAADPLPEQTTISINQESIDARVLVNSAASSARRVRRVVDLRQSISQAAYLSLKTWLYGVLIKGAQASNLSEMVVRFSIAGTERWKNTSPCAILWECKCSSEDGGILRPYPDNQLASNTFEMTSKWRKARVYRSGIPWKQEAEPPQTHSLDLVSIKDRTGSSAKVSGIEFGFVYSPGDDYLKRMQELHSGKATTLSATVSTSAFLRVADPKLGQAQASLTKVAQQAGRNMSGTFEVNITDEHTLVRLRQQMAKYLSCTSAHKKNATNTPRETLSKAAYEHDYVQVQGRVASWLRSSGVSSATTRHIMKINLRRWQRLHPPYVTLWNHTPNRSGKAHTSTKDPQSTDLGPSASMDTVEAEEINTASYWLETYDMMGTVDEPQLWPTHLGISEYADQ